MCVICFLLYNTLGFGKEDAEIRGKKKVTRQKKYSNALLRIQFGNLRSNN
jgi:hypothetical protein